MQFLQDIHVYTDLKHVHELLRDIEFSWILSSVGSFYTDLVLYSGSSFSFECLQTIDVMDMMKDVIEGDDSSDNSDKSHKKETIFRRQIQAKVTVLKQNES